MFDLSNKSNNAISRRRKFIKQVIKLFSNQLASLCVIKITGVRVVAQKEKQFEMEKRMKSVVNQVNHLVYDDQWINYTDCILLYRKKRATKK